MSRSSNDCVERSALSNGEGSSTEENFASTSLVPAHADVPKPTRSEIDRTREELGVSDTSSEDDEVFKYDNAAERDYVLERSLNDKYVTVPKHHILPKLTGMNFFYADVNYMPSRKMLLRNKSCLPGMCWLLYCKKCGDVQCKTYHTSLHMLFEEVSLCQYCAAYGRSVLIDNTATEFFAIPISVIRERVMAM